MKTVYPDYYPRFQCLAGACRHTCCAGWEIDLDAAALRRYMRMKGPLGERLRAAILLGEDGLCFRMEEGERCPFLNADGLCEVILERGEGTLCTICAEHPRFYHFLRDRREVGLGLCCEAACALILHRKVPMCLITETVRESKTQPTAWQRAYLDMRTVLLGAAQDRTVSISERMERIAQMVGRKHAAFDLPSWADFLLSLEWMEEAWRNRLQALRSGPCGGGRDEIMLEQLLVYFLYRHLYDGFAAGAVPEYVAFALLSTQLIGAMARDDDDLPEAARTYSAEIEYSDENVDCVIERLRDTEG